MAKLYLIALDTTENPGYPSFSALKHPVKGAMEVLDFEDALAKATGADRSFDADPEQSERCDLIDFGAILTEMAELMRNA